MIAVIDYKAGNLTSVGLALEKLGFRFRITRRPKDILDAERIIFPGVGAAGKAIQDLKEMGLDRVLREAHEEAKPILGICLGAQIVLDKSEENQAPCLGLIPGTVKRFPSPLLSKNRAERLKIPHMGWNGVTLVRRHPVMEGIGADDEFYFVHSYYPAPALEQHVVGRTDYGMDFASILGAANVIATQFHPEKSGAAGLRLLKNFCTWNGSHAE